MVLEMTNPMFPQLLKAIEAIVNKQILCTVPQVMEPMMEDLVKTKFPEVIISIFPQVMLPIVEDSVRKVVKEESQSANEKKMDGGNRNLLLKFLDEVSDDVLTGKEIKGKEGTPMRVAIVDDATELPIVNGPESSAKVEILFLEACENENEHNLSHEVFNSKIIKESDKTKPHFAKSYHVYLDKGIGVLTNAKLANDKNWTKSCRCRLGARVAESLSGTMVKEGWTKPFMVSDSRGKLYRKRYPPSLSDEVWRLYHIGKDGGPCKRLKQKHVFTIEDFRFFLSVDPDELQKTISPRNAEDWKAMVDHAKACNIDDKRLFVYKNSSECNMSVVFNVVGELKGVIHDAHYILINHVQEAEKSCARSLMRSAFESRKDISKHKKKITEFSSEMTLMTQFPCRTSYEVPNASIPQSVRVVCNPTTDISRQAEAPEYLASAYQQQSEINNCNNMDPPQEHLIGSNGSWGTGDMPILDSPHCRKSNPTTDFDVQYMVENFLVNSPLPTDHNGQPNPVSEPNADQDPRHFRSVGSGPYSPGPSQFHGVGSGHSSPGPSKFHTARSIPIQETTKSSTWSQGINTSIRASGYANNDLDFDSLGLPTIEQLDDLNTDSFRSQGCTDCVKRDIPLPKDKVYILVNICKLDDIHKRLQDHAILTVEDFLIRLLRDAEGLKRIVEMEPKKWSDTVRNARACTKERKYCYVDFQKKAWIVFNILGTVLGLHIPESDKVEAGEFLATAYKHWGDVCHFDDENSLREHLIGLKKYLDPPNMQVPNPDHVTSSHLSPNREFGGGDINVEMAEADNNQTRSSPSQQLNLEDFTSSQPTSNDVNSFREHLIGLRRYLDPPNMQVPNPDNVASAHLSPDREFGGGDINVEMVEAVNNQIRSSPSQLLNLEDFNWTFEPTSNDVLQQWYEQ